MMKPCLDCGRLSKGSRCRLCAGMSPYYKLEWWRVSRQVTTRDGACVRCGGTNRLSAHHVIPRAEGGPDEPENLVSLCVRATRRWRPHNAPGSAIISRAYLIRRVMKASAMAERPSIQISTLKDSPTPESLEAIEAAKRVVRPADERTRNVGPAGPAGITAMSRLTLTAWRRTLTS
jgi:hypothetical protein